MKTLVLLTCLLLPTVMLPQKRISWKTVKVYQFASTGYPFGTTESRTGYVEGERHIRIRSRPKTLEDLSPKQLIRLKKRLARMGAEIVYVDTGRYYGDDPGSDEFYILYLCKE